MSQIKEETPPANARTFGAAVRKTLKTLGLDWKVSCKTVSFAGFGYGSTPFAEVACARLLTYVECSTLADTVRALRADPDGGRGIVTLAGKDYTFGGSIGYLEYPSGAGFWLRYSLDVFAYDKAEQKVVTPVMREAARRAELAYATEKPSLPKDTWIRAWLQSGEDSPEVWGRGWPNIYAPEDGPLTHSRPELPQATARP
jgi:hypothetical protein